MKKLIGYGILFSLFSAWLTVGAFLIGIIPVISVLSVVVALAGLIYLAVTLIYED